MVVKLERKFDPVKMSNRISQLEMENRKLRQQVLFLNKENNSLKNELSLFNNETYKVDLVNYGYSLDEFVHYVKNNTV